MKTARWLIAAGSLILFCTALLHGSGYPKLSAAIESSGANPIVVGAFKALWLMFSAHAIVLSVVFVVASRTPGGKRLVLLCLLIPAFDLVLLFHFLGMFIGTISVAVATLLFLVGGLLLPQGSQASSAC